LSESFDGIADKAIEWLMAQRIAYTPSKHHCKIAKYRKRKHLSKTNKFQAFIWIAKWLTCEGKKPNKRKARVSLPRTPHKPPPR